MSTKEVFVVMHMPEAGPETCRGLCESLEEARALMDSDAPEDAGITAPSMPAATPLEWGGADGWSFIITTQQQQEATASTHPGPRLHTASIPGSTRYTVLTIAEIRDLAAFAGLRVSLDGSRLNEHELDTEIAISLEPAEVADDNGQPTRYAHFAHFAEYPAEGSMGLGETLVVEETT